MFGLALCLLLTGSSIGQDQVVVFRNTLDAAINLILTDNRDGTETTIFIARGDTGQFAVPAGASLFNARVMPQDNVRTGFRFEDRNLAALAVNRQGQPVPLGGIVVNKCCWYRTCRKIFGRWACHCTSERVAVFIDEPDENGVVRRVQAPIETYDTDSQEFGAAR